MTVVRAENTAEDRTAVSLRMTARKDQTSFTKGGWVCLKRWAPPLPFPSTHIPRESWESNTIYTEMSVSWIGQRQWHGSVKDGTVIHHSLLHIFTVLVKFCCINFNRFTSGNTWRISRFHNRFNFFFSLFSWNYLCVYKIWSDIVVFKDTLTCVITELIAIFGCACWNLSSMFPLFLSALSGLIKNWDYLLACAKHFIEWKCYPKKHSFLL